MSNNGGPKGTTAPVKPVVDFVKPNRADLDKVFAASASDPPATEIQFGLWDNAVEVISLTPTTPKLIFLNGESEKRNFVGSDSRRFYIRVTDPTSTGAGFVEVDWWTAFTNSVSRTPGTFLDDPGSKLTLFETGPKTGVFSSRGLMLVVDAMDRLVVTHSGIPAKDPVLGKQSGERRDTESNYRIRRAGMHNFVVAQYSPKLSPKTVVTTVAPIFLKAGTRVLPVHVYVVRKPDGDVSVPLDEIFNIDLRIVTETYTRIGVWLFTVVAAADKGKPGLEVKTGGSPIVYTLSVINPPAGVDPTKVNQEAIEKLAKAFPGDPNVLRLFYVDTLFYVPKLLGISFGPKYNTSSDAIIMPPPQPIPAILNGVCVVQNDRAPYVAAHELGHNLTDKPASLNDGHYNSPGGRRLAEMNLMFEGVGGRKKEGPLTPKRLWDTNDADSVDQIFQITLKSPFLRPP